MASFVLAAFLENPTWEDFERCRRVDLQALADHYSVAIPTGLVKAEVREKVLEIGRAHV